ncbi:hypothetical protein IJ596_08250, partial [bacterium]|nr:hypothetical protein [bacterium]
MVCKMLFFDYRDVEKPFFDNTEINNYDIKFFPHPLNIETVKDLSGEDLEQTSVISVFITSHINPEVLKKFKNLRVIATRSARYGHIDLPSCINNNIALVNVEAYKDKPVEMILKDSFESITGVLC